MAQYVKEVNDAYLSDNIIDEMGMRFADAYVLNSLLTIS